MFVGMRGVRRVNSSPYFARVSEYGVAPYGWVHRGHPPTSGDLTNP
jgi:hypothetical protein